MVTVEATGELLLLHALDNGRGFVTCKLLTEQHFNCVPAHEKYLAKTKDLNIVLISG